MSKKFFGRFKTTKYEDLFEEKTLQNMLENKRQKEKEFEEKQHDFLLESRFQLLQDSLRKAKLGTDEFNALLSECINIYMELNEVDESNKDSIVKFAKDKLFKDEFIGKFDDKEVKKSPDASWPPGRITLKEAIPKEKIGQNKDAPYSDKVEQACGWDKDIDNQPSPSTTAEKEIK